MASERAVSSVIGVVLILAITVGAITSMMVIGTYTLDQSQRDAQLSQMETSMAQMSSKASLSAFGDASSQRFDLGRVSDAGVTVDPDAGSVTLEMVDQNGSVSEIYPPQPLGVVMFEQGEHAIAFQGGGVWSRSGNDGGTMVSPPEYHYREETLTFPILRVAGDGQATGAVHGTIEKGETDRIFPTEARANPVEDFSVFVEIESEYHRGWYEFFASRTTGAIDHDPDNRTVRMELTVPFEEEFSSAVAAGTATEIHQNADIESAEEGSNHASASADIDGRLTACDESEYPEFNASRTFYTGGETYCANETVELENNVTFDTEDGDIEVVLPHAFDISGEDIEIGGNGSVNIYARDEIEFGNADVNDEGTADQLFVYVHSDVSDITESGSFVMTGVLYAPNTDVTFTGGVEFHGAIIADTFHADNAAIEVSFDDTLIDVRFGVGSETDVIRFLHVTENIVEFFLR